MKNPDNKSHPTEITSNSEPLHMFIGQHNLPPSPPPRMYLFHSFHFWLQHLFALEYAFVFLPVFHYCYHWVFFDLNEKKKNKFKKTPQIFLVTTRFFYKQQRNLKSEDKTNQQFLAK